MSSDYTRVPIIELFDQLLVPLQGDITDSLAERLTSDVLERIRSSGAAGLVIDLTGVWMLDSHLCAVLSTMAASARLMGARTVVCGMNPDTAMTLQTMGVEMRFSNTALKLEGALEALGVRLVVDRNDAFDGDMDAEQENTDGG